ncbi:hypothetical protein AAF712_015369 [Marasmius tenuissimus]|uniref:Uncharacterized protein n=1 Tax=Marasmius tenuissimus TaxID=585030 RepID=A0ABR2Z8G1_9AGAR
MSQSAKPAKRTRAWLRSPDGGTQIRLIQKQDFDNNSHPVVLKMKDIHNDVEMDWEKVIRYVQNCTSAATDPCHSIARDLQRSYREWKADKKSASVSHGEKRNFIHNLGIGREYSVSEAIQRNETSIILPGGTTLQLVYRKPDPNPKFNTHHHMTDLPTEFGPATKLRVKDPVVVDVENGFYIVEQDTSILFYSRDDTSDDPSDMRIKIHLVVIRGVALPHSEKASQYVNGSDFYKFLKSVVVLASTKRRNQRPIEARQKSNGHEGIMTQIGLTNGARDKRTPSTGSCTSWGVSYKRKYPEEDCIAHDEDVVAVSSIFWSLILSMMPREVTAPVKEQLESHSMPHLASRYVEPGRGFSLDLNGKSYDFPLAERAPPEVYLTQGYSAWSHTDRKYAPYAFNLTAAREQGETLTSGNIEIPSYGGANFVDVNLRVVVINAPATMFAFDPEHVHGTTVTGGTINYNITITFSSRIGESIQKLAGQGHVFEDAIWKAGEKNLDEPEDEMA